MNNGYLGMVRQWQELFWDRRYSHVDMGERPGLGQARRRLRRDRHPADRQVDAGRDLREAIATPGPVVVDVRVTREENTYPMIPAGSAAREMVG